MARAALILCVGLAVMLGGCQKKEPAKVTAKDVKEKTAEAARTAADYAKQEKEDYVNRVQKEIDEIRKGIDNLRGKAKTASAKVKATLDREIEVAEDKWKVAEQRFSELKSASAEAWEGLKSGVDKAMDSLRESLSRAKKESE